MGIDYELNVLPFPPRFLQREFLDINVLGTVPFFTDGETTMTESTAICHYLVERYRQSEFGIEPGHPEFGDYLNWLYQSDATLTFPQTLVLRYRELEPEERRQPQVVEDYGRWFIARLRRLDAHIPGREFLCGGRFTIADIAVGYALYLGKLQGMDQGYSPQVKEYLERLEKRSCFQKAVALTADQGSTWGGGD
jgi:glutathione S-transferase